MVSFLFSHYCKHTENLSNLFKFMCSKQTIYNDGSRTKNGEGRYYALRERKKKNERKNTYSDSSQSYQNGLKRDVMVACRMQK